jgi:serine/threonine protein kinase
MAMTSQLLKGRYQTLQELGNGGFGKTFLAEDTHIPSRRKCVIKQLKAVHDNPQIYQLVQQRFEREAAVLEELGDRHHQIPRLYAYFTDNERFYLVEEWIQGQTLAQEIRQKGTLSEGVVKELLLSLLPVLEYIQTRGIIHRDIKPENIILRSTDGLPVLIDFGSVKETMGTVVTSSGNSDRSIIAGTPGFMASEQCAGRPVFASDLYSLGLTAIYLLTGKLPSEIESNPHTGEMYWRQYGNNVSQSFAAFLDKTIHPNARERYLNAKMMQAALQTLPGSSSPDTVITPPKTSSQSNAQTPITVITPVNGSNDSSPPTRLDSPSSSPMLGGGGTFNTSVPVPPEILGWNWGAFLLPCYWPFGTRVWIGLLAWIPLVNLVMCFVLGAQGNKWAWRSREWRSIEAFKAHQKSWAIAGGIVWGLMLGAVALSTPQAIMTQYNQSQTPTPTQPSQEPSNTQPPTPVIPSPQPTVESLDTPPVVSIGGNSEQTTAPTAFINGYWKLEFTAGETVHQSLLFMRGNQGEMIVQYVDPSSQKKELVYQTIRLWSCSAGLIVKGYNPVDADTKQSHPTYSPDEMLFQKKSDGSIVADNCSGGVCSTVSVQYLGETLKK